ncbi:MAG: ATP-binding protein [Cyclobacteriaceae bacterium]
MLSDDNEELRISALENVKSIAAVRNRMEEEFAVKIKELGDSEVRMKIALGESEAAREINAAILMELTEERETLETLNHLAPILASNLDLESLVQQVTNQATKITGAAFGSFFYNVINEDGKALMLYTISGASKEAFSSFGMPRATEIFGPTFRGEGTIRSDDITADPRYGQNKPYHGMPVGHLPVKSYLAVPVVSRTCEVIGGLFFGHPDKAIFSNRDERIVEGVAALTAVGIDNARLYEQVKQGKKKAETASKAKTDFLTTMSHEIRTPMNAIIGLSTILSLSSPLTAKQTNFIKTLQSSADSLLALINDLLDISKIEAQSAELENVPFSLYKLVEEVVSMISVQAKEKGLKFTADFESVQKLIFCSDPTRLRQILNNLCGNAVKFTEYGKVSLKILKEEGNDIGLAKLSFIVSDTGIGIPEEKLDLIFDKFVQVDMSINRRYEGTGLGLFIMKCLVTAMGGTVSVKSNMNGGSEFTVCLELRLASDELSDLNEQMIPTSQKSIPSKKPCILIVEDHEANILVASAFLDSLGYDYDVARNGTEALKKIKALEYDVALMDVQMPGLNGYETTQLFRIEEKNERKKRMPIIGVTAHAMAGDKERCIKSGMDDYMSKPFSLNELSNKIIALIGKKE